MYRSIRLFALLALLLPFLTPETAHAQRGYALSEFSLLIDGEFVPSDTPLEAGQDFEIGLFLTQVGPFREAHAAGTLTFGLDGAECLVEPRESCLFGLSIGDTFPNFDCTGGTDGAPLVCTWDEIPPRDRDGGGSTRGTPLSLTAPLVDQETQITVTGTVAPFEPGPPGSAETQDITLTVQPPEAGPTDLETTLTLPAEVPPEAEFTFDVTVRNNGPEPSQPFAMTAAGPTILSADPDDGCSISNAGVLQCDGKGPLAVGESVTITVTAQAPAQGEDDPDFIVQGRWLNADQEDPAPGNDLIIDRIPFGDGGEADLSITKTASGGPQIAIGTSFSYLVTVTNTGDATAQSVMLTDMIPGTVNVDGVTSSKGTCSLNDGLLQCNLGDIDPDATATVTIEVTAASVGDATNVAQTETGSANVEVTIVEAPKFELCGQKFLDRNGDGVRDDADPGWGGVTIELRDEAGNVVSTRRTNATDLDGDETIDPFAEQGRFCFEDLSPGTYTVREVAPPGFQQTFPPAPGTHTVELATGSQPLLLFGNAPFEEGDDGDDDDDNDDPSDLPIPDSLQVDFGDLPDPRTDVTCPPGVLACYPTLGVLGAWHVIVPGGPLLGTSVDDDSNGQPEVIALGDDALDGNDDEDGLISYTIQDDGSIQFELFATVPPGGKAFVDAWADLDDDGIFQTIGPGIPPPPEYVLVRRPVTNGPNTLTTGPGLVDPNQRLTYARFRITSTGVNLPLYVAFDGEVEDYLLIGADFGDAPGTVDPDHPAFPGGYPTTLAQDGARHVASFNTRLGDYIDADGQVEGSFDAQEDDENLQQDDEDGIRFLDGFMIDTDEEAGEHLILEPGTAARLLPLPSVDGKLDAWVDWNRDGDWDDDGEKIFASVDIGPEMDEDDALSLTAPSDAAAGYTYARFRFSRLGGLTPTGAAPDGEVEDYLLRIGAADTTPIEEGSNLPERFVLHGNYPNPFNPATTLRFDLPEAAEVRVAVYDVLGREVLTLAPGRMAAGTGRTLTLDARSLASGAYLYRVTAEGATQTYRATGRFVLLR